MCFLLFQIFKFIHPLIIFKLFFIEIKYLLIQLMDYILFLILILSLIFIIKLFILIFLIH